MKCTRAISRAYISSPLVDTSRGTSGDGRISFFRNCRPLNAAVRETSREIILIPQRADLSTLNFIDDKSTRTRVYRGREPRKRRCSFPPERPRGQGDFTWSAAAIASPLMFHAGRDSRATSDARKRETNDVSAECFEKTVKLASFEKSGTLER